MRQKKHVIPTLGHLVKLNNSLIKMNKVVKLDDLKSYDFL
jgi:hypothetical protein